jgi:hypothetical protein
LALATCVVDVDEAVVDGVVVDAVVVAEAVVDGVVVDEAVVAGVVVDEAVVAGVVVAEAAGVPGVAGVGGALMRINAAKFTMSEE